jgi:hypothetical protein
VSRLVALMRCINAISFNDRRVHRRPGGRVLRMRKYQLSCLIQGNRRNRISLRQHRGGRYQHQQVHLLRRLERLPQRHPAPKRRAYQRIRVQPSRAAACAIVCARSFTDCDVEIGIGDGTTRCSGPGDVTLANDLTGQGYTSRSVGDCSYAAILTRLREGNETFSPLTMSVRLR